MHAAHESIVGDAHERQASTEDRLKRLTQISRGFTYASSLSDILRYAAEQAADLLDAEKAILMLADDDGLLRVHASFGVDDDVVERFRASFDESLVSRFQGLFGTAEGFLGVPLVVQGRVIGLMAVMRRSDAEVSADDEWLLSALADQMAAPLENAKLAATIQRAALLVENARLYESERAARRDAEEARGQAEAANRAKSEFIANMSHELRTPLNAIAGYVELLQLEVRGPLNDAQREDLRRIHQNQRLLLSLINDVLNFARLESGHVEFALRDVPVRQALGEMEALIMPQMLARSLHYEVRPVEANLVVHADAEKLQQIILNLLTNAVKYTSNHGRIDLGATRAGEFVLIQVRDTGRGIPSEKLEQIFAPFVRIDTGYSRTTEGVGLGLAISRDLARAMGGDLTVESRLGEGSTFTLRLPRGSVARV